MKYDNFYEDLDIPKPKQTIWSASLPFTSEKYWFEEEVDLKNYMDSCLVKRKKYYVHLFIHI